MCLHVVNHKMPSNHILEDHGHMLLDSMCSLKNFQPTSASHRRIEDRFEEEEEEEV